MILTVCLSPCIDVTIEVDALNVGKYNVLKNKSTTFAGKALNVAIDVARLGGNAYLTGFMYNENGSEFETLLDREGVPFTFVWNRGRVRENYKIIDGKSMLTEINGVSERVEEDKLIELSSMVQNLSSRASVTVISGALPKDVGHEYYGSLFRMVSPSCKKVVDAEGARMFSALGVGVDLVKPNLEELKTSLGRELNTQDEVLYGCRELIERGAKIVLLSLGKQGALITDGRETHYCRSMNVAVNSTVGAGDAMVAAAALQLERGAELPEILRAGVAAGTASVSTFGSMWFKGEKYEEIYENLSVKRIE